LGKSNGEYFLSANGDWADIIPAVEKLVGDNPNVVICLVGNCTMSLDGGECLEVVDAYLFPDGTTPPTAVAVGHVGGLHPSQTDQQNLRPIA
jgi:hypothetical protein